MKDNVVYAGLGAKEIQIHKRVLNRAEAYIKKCCSESEVQDREQSGAGYQSLISSASHSKNVMTEKKELARPKKKLRLEEIVDSSGAPMLMFSLPVPEDFQLTNMSNSEREAIVEQLTEHFYKCISKAPTFVNLALQKKGLVSEMIGVFCNPLILKGFLVGDTGIEPVTPAV